MFRNRQVLAYKACGCATKIFCTLIKLTEHFAPLLQGTCLSLWSFTPVVRGEKYQDTFGMVNLANCSNIATNETIYCFKVSMTSIFPPFIWTCFICQLPKLRTNFRTFFHGKPHVYVSLNASKPYSFLCFSFSRSTFHP